MKQIPNIFTLLNLVFGCIAIVLILQTGETIVILDQAGTTQVTLPEKIWQGSLFIFGAAIVDFLDGFLARLLKANSEKGKQLDSLCDMVSFGVAPGMILYQLLRIGYAQQENGLDVSVAALLPAFVFPCAVAWRLAKFNISTNQTYSFKGVPCPAAGLFVASFPLIIWYQEFGIQHYFINVWLLYGVIFVTSYLMVSNRSFMAFKFTNYSLKNNLLKYVLLALSVVCILTLGWLSIPVIFVLYLVFSSFSKEPPPMVTEANRTTLDVTV